MNSGWTRHIIRSDWYQMDSELTISKVLDITIADTYVCVLVTLCHKRNEFVTKFQLGIIKNGFSWNGRAI